MAHSQVFLRAITGQGHLGYVQSNTKNKTSMKPRWQWKGLAGSLGSDQREISRSDSIGVSYQERVSPPGIPQTRCEIKGINADPT